MSDRLVHRVGQDQINEGPLPFSTYLQCRNIVLLGDPGAGKTHLFRHFAVLTGGIWIRAREFLTTPVTRLGKNQAFYIDALDEQRAARGERDTIDRVISKLWDVDATQVRLACRAADWLGETDLAAFGTYFDQSGSSVVLRLLPLCRDEQLSLLATNEIEDGDLFLDEAARRGLGFMLGNPQNLSMLAEVVRKRAWPATRFELFKESTELLLSEHNPDHAWRSYGARSAQELHDSAGAACAVRLISDISGISLKDTALSEDRPSYRTLSLCKSEELIAALMRRAFVAGPQADSVDYAHRTIAEFLAAKFLAERISSGLPLGRVLALLGINGRPATELRGVQGWLAVFAPQDAPVLIDSDPQGILLYGDPASLSLANQKLLLRSLAKLGQQDPWFHHALGEMRDVAALSTLGLADEFSQILANPSAGFGLRSLVLDALCVGKPIPSLRQSLRAILVDSQSPYYERDASLRALQNIGIDGESEVQSAYDEIGTTADDLRLRCRIISTFYGNRFGAPHAAALLNAAAKVEDELLVGSFWSFHEVIPEIDIEDLLQRVDLDLKKDTQRRNAYEILHVVDHLISKWVVHCHTSHVGCLFDILSKRRVLTKYTSVDGQVLQTALRTNAQVTSALTDAAIENVDLSKRNWGFVQELRELSLHVLDFGDLLAHISEWVLSQGERSEKRTFLYEQALDLTFYCTQRSQEYFERLYAFADDKDDLLPTRTRCCFWTVPEWRIEQSERRSETEQQRRQSIARNREDFLKHIEVIRRGAHVGWLTWLGKVYFGLFSDVDRAVTERQRIAQQLGDDNVQVAIDGLIAFSRSHKITPLEEVASMSAESKMYEHWHAYMAALDEYFEEYRTLDHISPGAWQSAIAIDCVHPTYRQERNVSYQVAHSWKNEVLRNHPRWAADAYYALVNASLENNASNNPFGCHEIVTTEELKPYAAHMALELLAKYPLMNHFALKQLIIATLSGYTREHLLPNARTGLEQCNASDQLDRYCLWLAFCFVCSPEEFQLQVVELDEAAARGFIWALRDLGAIGHGDGNAQLPLQQLTWVLSFIAQHYQNTDHPKNSWSGDTNPWDASELIRRTIASISADPIPDATSALETLCYIPSLNSYSDYARHALAQQKIKRLNSEFRQPDYKETIEVLGNGKPARVSDLYALVIAHLRDIKIALKHANTDPYKRFWNEDRRGRTTAPKAEESCRDALVDMLRKPLAPHSVLVEPEGHMAADKRADIVAQLPAIKLVIELKRDYHADVWKAATNQLDRFYTRDPEAKGYGIYGIFWFGQNRSKGIPTSPDGLPPPTSAFEMEHRLNALLPEEARGRIMALVFDVSGPA